MEDLLRLVVRYTNIPPLSLYDYTIAELNIMISEGIKKEKEELTNLCHVIRTGVSSVYNNTPIKLFEDEEENSDYKKINREEKERTLEFIHSMD